MKLLLICLLIINAVVFAVWGNHVGDSKATNEQSQRLTQPQNGAHLELISKQMALAPAANPVATDSPTELEPVSCLVWGPFAPSDLTKANAKLKSLSLKSPPSQQQLPEPDATIVFISALESKEAAEKKVEELRQMGVKDFFVVHDQAAKHWGISLGVYKSEESAKQLAAMLTNKGVKNVRTKAYVIPNSVNKNRFNYVFNNLSSAELASLENLKSAFSTQELRTCK